MDPVSILCQPIKHASWLQTDKLQLGCVAGVELQDGSHSIPVVTFAQHGRLIATGETIAQHKSTFSLKITSFTCLDPKASDRQFQKLIPILLSRPVPSGSKLYLAGRYISGQGKIYDSQAPGLPFTADPWLRHTATNDQYGSASCSSIPEHVHLE
jgi:hypothetical protein